MHAPWNLDPTRILTRRELATLLTGGVSCPRARRWGWLACGLDHPSWPPYLHQPRPGRRPLAGRSSRRAGHANVAITSVYLHVAIDNEGGVGDLFKFE
jgi:hypothetical protein